MNEETAWAIIGVAIVAAITTITVWVVALTTVASTATWQTCIEAGRQMVNGVCL